jgi:molecular chaperone GrpE (heat shock protein)
MSCEELKRLSKSELLKTFNKEIKAAEDFIKEEMENRKKEWERYEELFISYIRYSFLSQMMRAVERNGDHEKAIKISKQLEELKRTFRERFGLTLKELKAALNSDPLKDLNNLRNLINKYKRRYDEMVYEGYGTVQKVTEEFLIEAIANIRRTVMKIRGSQDTAPS